MSDNIIAFNREWVRTSYSTATAYNARKFAKGDDKATSEYIYPNQKEDAARITYEFYENHRRVVSVVKKTKVGADGLMIEIAHIMCTHSDEKIVDPECVRIITGMSNASWEKDMIEKAPECFKNRIFHHDKLKKADLKNMKNSLIIIDEIDTGDKEFQVLHTTLQEAGVLDVTHMRENNNRFVFISATMLKELCDLYRWGDLHCSYNMTIPDSYIGHKEFLERGILKEFYDMSTEEEAARWIREDILDNYGLDSRVHIARITEKTVNVLRSACLHNGVDFRIHTSADRLSDEEIKEFFKDPLPRHIVLGVKGFFRRANLIPNAWKLRIGATHELFTKVVDNSVQIQGLPGRMTGYWKSDILRGHKTGPHRTSIEAVEEYENAYADPFGDGSYKTAGFTKKNGRITTHKPTMLKAENANVVNPAELPAHNGLPDGIEDEWFEFNSIEELKRKFPRAGNRKADDDGFFRTTQTGPKSVQSVADIDKIKAGSKTAHLHGKIASIRDGTPSRRTFVGYRDVKDTTTAIFYLHEVRRVPEA